MIPDEPNKALMIRLGIPEDEINLIHTSHDFNAWMERLGYETRAIPGECIWYTFTRLKSEVKQ